MELIRNIKNKSVYIVLDRNVKDANNGNEDAEPLVLYSDIAGQKYIRSKSEFNKKFKND